MNMSIEGMISISHLLYVMAGISAVLGMALFFALDIAKCWRMVSGNYPGRGAKRQKPDMTGTVETEKIRDSELLAGSEETMLLARQASMETDMAEETELLDTGALEMIQDIVYVRNA